MRECLLLCLTFLLLVSFIDKMTLNRTFIILRIKVIFGFPPRDNEIEVNTCVCLVSWCEMGLNMS